MEKSKLRQLLDAAHLEPLDRQNGGIYDDDDEAERKAEWHWAGYILLICIICYCGILAYFIARAIGI